jgi:ketosteroid isomerase-like protein
MAARGGVGYVAASTAGKQEIMSDDISTIERVYRRYFAEFQTLNARAILPYFHSPCMFMSRDGVFGLQTGAQLESFFERMLHNLVAQGYARSELQDLQIKLLTPNLAAVNIRGARYQASGALLESLSGLYTMCKSADGTWRIAVVTMVDSEHPIQLS